MTLGEFLGKQLSEKEEMKADMSREDEVSAWFLFPTTRLEIKTTDYDVNDENINGSLFGGYTPYSIFGTTGVAFGFRGTGQSDVSTEILTQSLTIGGRNEIRDWLGNISTARPITGIALSNSTANFSVNSTAMPGTVLTTLTPTNNITGDLQTYTGTFATPTADYGTVRSIGLTNTAGNVLYGFYNLGTAVPILNTKIYVFSVTSRTRDASGGDSFWTNVGTTRVHNWMGGTTITSPTDMAWSTGTVQAQTSDTTLEGETQRNTLTANTRPSDLANNWSSILTSSQGIGTINKSALFNAGTAEGGDMFIEQQHDFGIIKTTLFQIEETMKNTII